jgi:hypothetical protein
MSSLIPGGETKIIKQAADSVADLVGGVRYLEGASGFHLEEGGGTEGVVQGSMELVHHMRSAEYGAKVALSALTSMEVIDESFDVERFTQEVEKIREEMRIPKHAS